MKSKRSPIASIIPLMSIISGVFGSLNSESATDTFVAGSLEAAYSLNWGAREIWGKGGGETLALL